MKKTIYTLGASLLLITLSLSSTVATAQSKTGQDNTTESQKESPSISDNGQQVEGATKRNISKKNKGYKTDRRNKKFGKLKYDNCESVESEKGASNSEVKAICTPPQ